MLEHSCLPLRRDNPRAKARGLSLRTGGQTMLYLTCISLASNLGVSRAKDLGIEKCATRYYTNVKSREDLYQQGVILYPFDKLVHMISVFKVRIALTTFERA